ncbi:MAG: UDP-phosphate N-acetylgalactosaminyl-1-phosphate transferase [Planctomycetes bacterium]|nr:UDP-phosphate N-acetylgalactosaminyl-1-phosphate transferase [Planctomycetota bacterium]
MTLASLVLRRRFILLKEVLDRCLALAGLIVFLPVLATLGVIIKLSSPGPVFFIQKRVGKGGKSFGIIKLRTMVTDAEQATGPIWAQENDPRITPIGRFLRASHFDEVPQLLNVLRGEMSIVGPRPERPVFVDQFRCQIPNYEARHMVKPGITGLAQVYHHYDETVRDVKRKLGYDLLYVKKMCLMVDIAILFLTFRRLTGKGAR